MSVTDNELVSLAARQIEIGREQARQYYVELQKQAMTADPLNDPRFDGLSGAEQRAVEDAASPTARGITNGLGGMGVGGLMGAFGGGLLGAGIGAARYGKLHPGAAGAGIAFGALAGGGLGLLGGGMAGAGVGAYRGVDSGRAVRRLSLDDLHEGHTDVDDERKIRESSSTAANGMMGAALGGGLGGMAFGGPVGVAAGAGIGMGAGVRRADDQRAKVRNRIVADNAHDDSWDHAFGSDKEASYTNLLTFAGLSD